MNASKSKSSSVVRGKTWHLPFEEYVDLAFTGHLGSCSLFSSGVTVVGYKQRLILVANSTFECSSLNLLGSIRMGPFRRRLVLLAQARLARR